MYEQQPDPEYLRQVFENTRILRRPISGIVTGYHVLPYVLVAPEETRGQHSVEIRGTIKVSPRLILAPRHLAQTYGQLFDDPDLMDKTLVGRIFSFLYAKRANVSVENEDLRITRVERDPQAQVERALDELTMREVLDTGVILSPDAKFYPVSIERFISEIVEREFQSP
jgi:hypothetical protein